MKWKEMKGGDRKEGEMEEGGRGRKEVTGWTKTWKDRDESWEEKRRETRRESERERRKKCGMRREQR